MKNGAVASSESEERDDACDGPAAFGRYQVIRHLASGGMGSVYLARDGVLQRDVAVKNVRAMPGKLGREFSARFLNEARCVASLKHPNIVPIFDLGLEGDVPYLVMEVVDGPALDEVIKNGTPSSSQAQVLGIQIANALEEAHKAGIVHRDVKPGNILRASSDNWKLVDFGVAHIPDSSLTTAGDFLGTPAYSAPESLKGDGATTASDIYGLGATLYHMLSGKPPYGVGNAVQIALRASSEAVPGLASITANLPSDLVLIVDRCLSHDPKLRPTAKELAEELAMVRSDLGGRAQGEAEQSQAEAKQSQAEAKRPENISVDSDTAYHNSDLSESAVATGGNKKALVGLLALGGLAVVIVLALRGSDAEQKLTSKSTLAGKVAGAEATGSKTTGSQNEAAESGDSLGVPPTAARITESKNYSAGDPEPGLGGLEELNQLIARKQIGQASRVLDKLRQKNPKSAYLAFTQGSLDMERLYWKDGFEAYRDAIDLDPRYRSHPRLIRDGIKGLSSKSQSWRASSFLIKNIGSAARPTLEAALEYMKNPKLKARLRVILKKIDD
ncbi:MAG: serine/threonine protein kinase [Kofleriaceae bacterium]|nr:serine/threonine protein kinase [Kofleriaceae bacterium]